MSLGLQGPRVIPRRLSTDMDRRRPCHLLYMISYSIASIVRSLENVNSLLPPLPAATSPDLPILVVPPITVPKLFSTSGDSILTNIDSLAILCAHRNLNRDILRLLDLASLAIILLIWLTQSYRPWDPRLGSQRPQITPARLLRVPERLPTK